MTFAVGLFDLFTYAFPGALHLAFFAYLADRLNWLDIGALTRGPVLLVVVVVVVVSYVLGYLVYPLGALADRVVPHRRERDPRAEILRRVPAAADRDFLRLHGFLLQAALEVIDRETTTEVNRFRAVGLMLRDSSPPMAFAFVASVVELIVGGNRVFAAFGALLFPALFLVAVSEGRRLRYWASLRTLEICLWIPDIDERARRAAGETVPED